MGIFFLVSKEHTLELGNKLSDIAWVYNHHFAFDQDFSVEVSLVSEQEMQLLNQKYRKVPEPTDVLSFPTFSTLKEIHSLKMSALLGSIVVSPEQAEKYQETLPQLVHHGLMHLLGFNHERDLVQWKIVEAKLITNFKKQQLAIKGIPA